MKYRDLIKLVEKDGWRYSYSTESHQHYFHRGKPGKVTILGHPSDEAHLKTLRSYSETGGFTMTRKYLVVHEWAGKNFSGYSPDVLGCVSTGKSLPAMRKNMKEALESHLQWMFDDGDPLPEAAAKTVEYDDEDKEFPYPAGYYFVVEKLEVTLPSRKKHSPSKRSTRPRKAA